MSLRFTRPKNGLVEIRVLEGMHGTVGYLVKKPNGWLVQPRAFRPVFDACKAVGVRSTDVMRSPPDRLMAEARARATKFFAPMVRHLQQAIEAIEAVELTPEEVADAKSAQAMLDRMLGQRR